VATTGGADRQGDANGSDERAGGGRVAREPVERKARATRRPDTDGADTRAAIPRDAATLVLIDRSGPHPRVLMGRRRPDMAFLPGKYVFPGGRVDPADRTAADAGDLDAAVIAALLRRMRGRPTPARARALARAAIRETREETGLLLGRRGAMPLPHLRFVARAITPPGRVRRYDTRFFLADAALVTAGSLAGDGELSDLGWFTFDAARRLDLPGITRLVIEDICEVVEHTTAPSVRGPPVQGQPVPFYYHRGGHFQRVVL
jgi:8-oxo-dGTP pyrophosphatase MutT (NUDIX family)